MKSRWGFEPQGSHGAIWDPFEFQARSNTTNPAWLPEYRGAWQGSCRYQFAHSFCQFTRIATAYIVKVEISTNR